MWSLGHGLAVDLKVLGEWLDLTLGLYPYLYLDLKGLYQPKQFCACVFLPSVFQPVYTTVREEQQIMPQAKRRQQGGFEDSG